jgi:hypothetical protein
MTITSPVRRSPNAQENQEGRANHGNPTLDERAEIGIFDDPGVTQHTEIEMTKDG